MRQSVLAFSLSFAFAVLTAGYSPAMPLVEDGKARAVILVDAEAPSSVVRAASELQYWVERVSGARLAVEHARPTDGDERFPILVGPRMVQSVLGLETEELGVDGFRVLADERALAIWGRDYEGPPITGYRNPWRPVEVYNAALQIGAFGETGTLYGVYHFLEDVCGIRWYIPGDLGVVAPARPTIAVDAMDVSVAPDFSYRYPWFCYMAEEEEDAVWFRRAGFGAPYPAQIIHSFHLLTPLYKDSHPEYFALIDGERDFTTLSVAHHGGNLCLSNPDVAAAWADYMNRYFDEHPEQHIFPLSPNDGMRRICDCDACQAQVVPDMGAAGKFSDYVWTFVNTVAEAVAKVHPDKFVGGIAYEAYNTPPRSIARLNPNVAVMLCKARSGYADAAYQSRIEASIAGWREKTDTLYCWEYYLDSWRPWRGLPTAYPHTIARDLSSLKGVIEGEFIEAESWQQGDDLPHKINFPGMQHLNLYVTAKCYWDADLDIEALLDEYYALFYGPARLPLKTFWEEAETIWMSQGGEAHAIGITREPTALYTPERLARLTELLDGGRAATAEGSVYRQRIDLIAAEFAPAKAMLANERVAHLPTLRLGLNATARPAEFDFVNKDGSPTRYTTKGYASCDEEHLVLAFINADPEAANVNVNATERDQSVAPGMWEEDSIEIFLAPDPENPSQCYQFIINANGLVWDAAYGLSGKDRSADIDWNSEVTTKAAIEETAWTLEVRIPWNDILGGPPTDGQTIRANFFRNRYCGQPVRYSCWSPVLGQAHNTPERMGTLRVAR